MLRENDLFIETKLEKPLSKEELNFYMEKVKNGDFSAREYVINHNILLVLDRVLKKFSNLPYDKRDLVSLGLIGLVKSVDTFDISKNYEFSTYAIKCIDNEILLYVRKDSKRINTQSLNEIVYIQADGEEKCLEDIIIDDYDFVLDCEKNFIYEKIRNKVNNLPDKYKEIIALYFGFFGNRPHTQIEIAKKLNVSRSYIPYLIKKILQQIEKELVEEKVIENVKQKKLSK